MPRGAKNFEVVGVSLLRGVNDTAPSVKLLASRNVRYDEVGEGVGGFRGVEAYGAALNVG